MFYPLCLKVLECRRIMPCLHLGSPAPIHRPEAPLVAGTAPLSPGAP